MNIVFPSTTESLTRALRHALTGCVLYISTGYGPWPPELTRKKKITFPHKLPEPYHANYSPSGEPLFIIF